MFRTFCPSNCSLFNSTGNYKSVNSYPIFTITNAKLFVVVFDISFCDVYVRIFVWLVSLEFCQGFFQHIHTCCRHGLISKVQHDKMLYKILFMDFFSIHETLFVFPKTTWYGNIIWQAATGPISFLIQDKNRLSLQISIALLKKPSLAKMFESINNETMLCKSWLNWDILLKGVTTETRRFTHKQFPGVKFDKASCSLSASTRNFRFRWGANSNFNFEVSKY